jgi:hypothetical protein
MEGKHSPLRSSLIAALLLIALVYHRVLTAGSETLANTSPLMAMCFGGGLLLGFRFCWVPVVLLVGSDLALGIFRGTGVGGYTIFTSLAFTGAAVAGAFFHRHRGKWAVMLAGTLLCSIGFYVAANTFVWASPPMTPTSLTYAKTFAGWWQSQTVGLPGYPPSILFLRNALIGDTLWCVLASPLFFWKPARLEQRNLEPAIPA